MTETLAALALLVEEAGYKMGLWFARKFFGYGEEDE